MNEQQLSEKWCTQFWRNLTPEELVVLNEAELFLTDFDLWTPIKKSASCEDFEMQYGECSLLYTLWYEGILQYVGKSHCFSRRMWQHFNAAGSSDAQYDPNKVKLFDEIRYIEVPSPATDLIRAQSGTRMTITTRQSDHVTQARDQGRGGLSQTIRMSHLHIFILSPTTDRAACLASTSMMSTSRNFFRII